MGLKKLGGEIKKMNKNLFRRSVYGTNASRNKCIVAFLLAAALLISMVGMASADQSWYLGADYLHKDGGAGGTYVAIGEKIWRANEPAQGDVNFGHGTWTGVIDFTDSSVGGHLDAGETITLSLGSLSGGIFTPAASQTVSGPKSAVWPVSLTPGSHFTVPSGDYLALKLAMSGGDVHVRVGGSSYIASPSGQEMPEFATIAIPVAAILGLLFFFNHRKRK